MATQKELTVNINAKTDGLKRGLKDGENQVNSFGKSISRIGGLVSAAFVASKIVAFTGEVIKLAGEAEGIEIAFQRIADKGFLNELQKSTRNTVSNLELMRKVVQANNFQLPLEQLPKLFEFASRRAQETGESVDYLVNSIVMGIGRKSPLILDNLGISAVRLRQELKGVGVESAGVADIAAIVGKIATEEMDKMGKATITAKDAQERYSAAWVNLKVVIGEKLTPVSKEFFLTLAEGLEATTAFLETKTLTAWQKFKIMLSSTTGFGNFAAAVANEVSKSDPKLLKEELETLFNKASQGVGGGAGTGAGIKVPITPTFEFKGGGGFQMDEITAIQMEIGKAIDDSMEAIDNMSPNLEALPEVLSKSQQAAKGFFDQMVSGAAASEEGVESLHKTVLNAARSEIKAQLALAVGEAIKNAMKTSGNPILGLILGGVGAAGVTALFNTLVPSFAQGGITNGPTLAMVGDNPSGKELMIPSEMWGKMGTQRIEVTGKIGHREIYLANKIYDERLRYNT